VALVFRGTRYVSVPEAAEQLGVTRLTVYRWMRGTRRSPMPIAAGAVIRDDRTEQVYIPEMLVRRLSRARVGAQNGIKGRRRGRPRPR
jgi:hypothetical protein